MCPKSVILGDRIPSDIPKCGNRYTGTGHDDCYLDDFTVNDDGSGQC